MFVVLLVGGVLAYVFKAQVIFLINSFKALDNFDFFLLDF